MSTTVELLDEYFDLQEDIDFLDGESEPGVVALLERREAVERDLFQKTDNIQHIILEKRKAQAIIDAQIEVYLAEVNRLRKKKRALGNAWVRLQELIMTIVKSLGKANKSGNPQLKVDTNSYTIIQMNGALEVFDEEKIPNNFIKMEQKIDSGALRKHIIELGGEMPFVARVQKKEVLRIT